MSKREHSLKYNQISQCIFQIFILWEKKHTLTKIILLKSQYFITKCNNKHWQFKASIHKIFYCDMHSVLIETHSSWFCSIVYFWFFFKCIWTHVFCIELKILCKIRCVPLCWVQLISNVWPAVRQCGRQQAAAAFSSFSYEMKKKRENSFRTSDYTIDTRRVHWISFYLILFHFIT